MKCLYGILAIAIVMGESSSVLAQGERVRIPDNVAIHRDLAYVKNGHERQHLDLYLPQTKEGPLPVIVWVHGGAWLAGSKQDTGSVLLLLRQGYAVASIGYRLSHHAIFPAQIEDCQTAIRFLRAHAKTYHLDPERIGVAGASAGGHLAALLGTAGDVKEWGEQGGYTDQSSRVQAVLDLFGPTDFTKMGGSHDRKTAPEAKLIGGPVQENREKAARANPITHITKDDPPFLILHGEADSVVPINQSELLAKALEEGGIEVDFLSLPGAGHGGGAFHSKEIQQRIEAFFENHLKSPQQPVKTLVK